MRINKSIETSLLALGGLGSLGMTFSAFLVLLFPQANHVKLNAIAVAGLVIVFAAAIFFRASKKWFWPLVFGRLPVSTGIGMDLSRKVRVLILVSSDRIELADDIKERYLDSHIDILVVAVEGTESSFPLLESRSEHVNGVYLIWSESTRGAKNLLQALETWSTDHSHKGVLVVNTLPNEPYELPYNTIPANEATSGLWRLFARTSDRGRLWRRQAVVNRRIVGLLLGVTVALSVLVITREGVPDTDFVDRRPKEIELVAENKYKRVKDGIQMRAAVQTFDRFPTSVFTTREQGILEQFRDKYPGSSQVIDDLLSDDFDLESKVRNGFNNSADGSCARFFNLLRREAMDQKLAVDARKTVFLDERFYALREEGVQLINLPRSPQEAIAVLEIRGVASDVMLKTTGDTSTLGTVLTVDGGIEIKKSSDTIFVCVYDGEILEFESENLTWDVTIDQIVNPGFWRKGDDAVVLSIMTETRVPTDVAITNTKGELGLVAETK